MARKQKKSQSSTEVKLKAVAEVLENNRPIAQVANDLGLHRDTVNRWVNAYNLNGKQGLENPRSNTQAPTSDKTKQLEKKIKELEMENEILKKFQAFLKQTE